MTQCEQVMDHLRQYGTINQHEAIVKYGIMRLAARVADLNKTTAIIKSRTVKKPNRNGKVVSFAEYYLADEDEV